MQTGTTVQPSKRPATAEDREGAIGATLLWIGVLVVLTVAAGLGLMWYRRKVLDRSSEGTQATLMEEFRRMRDSGEITAEEFDATKKAMVARLSGQAPRGVVKRPGGPDNSPGGGKEGSGAGGGAVGEG